LGEIKDAGGGGHGDSRWYPVYLLVLVVTVLVIAALWAFSRAFSS
jgi:hypothetical protein